MDLSAFWSGNPAAQSRALIAHLRSFSTPFSQSPGALAREGRWDEAVAVADRLPEDDAIVWRILLARLALTSGNKERASELVRTMDAPRSGAVLCYAHAAATAALLPEVLPSHPAGTFRLASSLFGASQGLSRYHGGVRSRELQSPLISFFSGLCRAKRFEEAQALLKIGRPRDTSTLLMRLLPDMIEEGFEEEARRLIPDEPGWMRENAVVRCYRALKQAKGDDAAQTFVRELGETATADRLLGEKAAEEGCFIPSSQPGGPADLCTQLDELAAYGRGPFRPQHCSKDWAIRTASLPLETVVQAAKSGSRYPAVALSSLAAFSRCVAPALSQELAIRSFDIALATGSAEVIEDTLDDCLDVAQELGRMDLAETWIEQWQSWRRSRMDSGECTSLAAALAEVVSEKKRFDLLGLLMKSCAQEETCREAARIAAATLTDRTELAKLSAALVGSPFPLPSLAVAILSLPEGIRSEAGPLGEALEARLDRATPVSSDTLRALILAGRTATALRLFEALPPSGRTDAHLGAALEARLREGRLKEAIDVLDVAGQPDIPHEARDHLTKALVEKTDEEIEGLVERSPSKSILATMLCSEFGRRGQTDRALHWLSRVGLAKRPFLLELAKDAFSAGHLQSGDRFLLEADRVDQKFLPSALENSDVARSAAALCAAGRPEQATALLEKHPSDYAAWQGIVALLEFRQPHWIARAVEIFLDQTRQVSDPAYNAYQYVDMMRRMAGAGFSIPPELVSAGLSICFRVPDLPAQAQHLSQIAWSLAEIGRWKDALPILDHMADSAIRGHLAARVVWEMLKEGQEESILQSSLLEAARADPSALVHVYDLALHKDQTILAKSILPTLLESEEATAAILGSTLDKLGPEELEAVVSETLKPR